MPKGVKSKTFYVSGTFLTALHIMIFFNPQDIFGNKNYCYLHFQIGILRLRETK